MIGNLVADAKDEVIWRRRHLLYQNPELSFEEDASMAALLANLATRLSMAACGAGKYA